MYYCDCCKTTLKIGSRRHTMSKKHQQNFELYRNSQIDWFSRDKNIKLITNLSKIPTDTLELIFTFIPSEQQSNIMSIKSQFTVNIEVNDNFKTYHCQLNNLPTVSVCYPNRIQPVIELKIVAKKNCYDKYYYDCDLDLNGRIHKLHTRFVNEQNIHINYTWIPYTKNYWFDTIIYNGY